MARGAARHAGSQTRLHHQVGIVHAAKGPRCRAVARTPALALARALALTLALAPKGALSRRKWKSGNRMRCGHDIFRSVVGNVDPKNGPRGSLEREMSRFPPIPVKMPPRGRSENFGEWAVFLPLKQSQKLEISGQGLGLGVCRGGGGGPEGLLFG